MELAEMETTILLNSGDMADLFFIFRTTDRHAFNRLVKRIGGADNLIEIETEKDADGTAWSWDCKVPVKYFNRTTFAIGQWKPRNLTAEQRQAKAVHVQKGPDHREQQCPPRVQRLRLFRSGKGRRNPFERTHGHPEAIYNRQNMDSIPDPITEAIAGQRGEQQRAIALECMAWVEMLLRKNKDYGGSALEVPMFAPGLPADSAILVRMSDKVERLRSVLGNGAEVSETVEDTIRDLGAYCLLWLVAKGGSR